MITTGGLNKTFLGFYFLASLITISSLNLIQLWIGLELITLTLILFMFDSSKVEGNDHILFFYFMIQAVSSIMFLICISFNSSSSLGEEVVNLMVLFSFLLKMGISPLFFWIVKMESNIKPIFFSFLISLHKTIPLFVLMLLPISLLWVFLLNSLNGVFMMFFSQTFSLLVFFSSLYSLIWFYMVFLLSNLKFLLFYLIYSLLIVFCFNLGSKLDFSLSKTNQILLSLGFLFILGLPPMPFFFLKIQSLEVASMFNSWALYIFIWFLVFGTLICYLNFFFKSLFGIEKNLYVPSSKFLSYYYMVPIWVSLLFFVTF